MSVADKPHGRTRYNAGCRCGVCRSANRDHSRRRRAGRPTVVVAGDGAAAPVGDGRVAAAVAAQLAGSGCVAERPGLAAVAIRLAELLDNPDAVPQHPAAAHRLTEILGVLAKGSERRGRLSLVRSMSGSGPAARK